MLETIREYALERLAESGAEAELRGRHAENFLRFAEEAARKIRGDVLSSGGRAHRSRLHQPQERLEWARDSDEGEVLLRLAAALASTGCALRLPRGTRLDAARA